MESKKQYVTVPIDFLTELLNVRKQHFLVCEAFKIPVEKRGEEWVGNGILERIRTYLTSYIGKRSIMERETGAAFAQIEQPDISDPLFPEEHEPKKI